VWTGGSYHHNTPLQQDDDEEEDDSMDNGGDDDDDNNNRTCVVVVMMMMWRMIRDFPTTVSVLVHSVVDTAHEDEGHGTVVVVGVVVLVVGQDVANHRCDASDSANTKTEVVSLVVVVIVVPPCHLRPFFPRWN
jgi:hypothetical protein